ncbi:hypothetical protein J2X12_002846 [Pseudarthrobacter oxydans]|uniref:Uncharacterized protein n=1 Tax=Pseudarthrobacter oxydans TaxID=1671 RepID=A0AAW8NFV2_PSEOX|nr:hypothetical protein [Pseudarthrobacter oxydans]MDR6794835.1 hypothetical protein [Pseudarthrobacter oxydans]MDR7164808.1 hypothetical protein [Pseudarthrobacter oxydans]
MRISAKQLLLKNINQLAASAANGSLYMGRLDSVVSSAGKYELTIGGNTFEVDGDHPIEIRRTEISESLQLANELTEDLLDSLGVAEDAAA